MNGIIAERVTGDFLLFPGVFSIAKWVCSAVLFRCNFCRILFRYVLTVFTLNDSFHLAIATHLQKRDSASCNASGAFCCGDNY
jgi:hypothetical protein